MLAEIELDNPKGELRPGMYASVRLELERKQDALTLPAEALVIEKEKASVIHYALFPKAAEKTRCFHRVQ